MLHNINKIENQLLKSRNKMIQIRYFQGEVDIKYLILDYNSVQLLWNIG